MTYQKRLSALTLLTALQTACGGDPGDTTTTSSTSEASTGGATTVEPTTGAASTGGTGSESGGISQGQTETGDTGSETGEPGTSTGGSSGGPLCADFEQPGCFIKGCPDGQACMVVEDECVSSACSCDERTGQIDCTPDCGGGSCVGVCPDIRCDKDCPFGFKLDRKGCQTCECNDPPACGCADDSDCVKTSSGCCPCSAGGDEVPASLECIDEVMKCDIPPDEVNCPQVFKCTDVQPACVQGQCVLQ